MTMLILAWVSEVPCSSWACRDPALWSRPFSNAVACNTRGKWASPKGFSLIIKSSSPEMPHITSFHKIIDQERLMLYHLTIWGPWKISHLASLGENQKMVDLTALMIIILTFQQIFVFQSFTLHDAYFYLSISTIFNLNLVC